MKLMKSPRIRNDFRRKTTDKNNKKMKKMLKHIKQ